MASWVLVIDDDPAFVALLTERLEQAGCYVTSASDGLQGFIQAESLKPVLVILDMVMPGFGSGADVIKQLRSHKNLSKVPVIVLSGLQPERVRPLLPPNDPNLRLMTKPPDWPLLMRLIRELIPQKPPAGAA
jgi:DNA-binding response OmpR family regulator